MRSLTTAASPFAERSLTERPDDLQRNCASCHGRSGGGGGIGPKLAGRVEEQYPDIEAQIQVIANGMGGMPAFGERLSPEQIEAVARYTREVL